LGEYLHRAKHLTGLPPRVAAFEVGWRLGRTAEQRIAASLERLHATRIGYDAQPISRFLLPGRDRPSAGDVGATAVASCIEEAERALAGDFEILGFGRLSFGHPPRWRSDPTSGNEWPLAPHASLAFAREGSDVKVPWEASRMHWLTALARAHAYTGERIYYDGAIDLLISWSNGNPAGFGVNWANAMEAGIRTVNLTWSAEIFADPFIDVLVGGLARRHGRYILGNLEYSPRLTSNHFLADLVGLVHAGGLLRHTAEGRTWLRLGARLLQREVTKQFHEDGMNFEASTAYHRLSTELVIFGLLALDRLDIPVATVVLSRLQAALDVLELVTGPGGRFPPIGDDDSGLVVGLASGRDHRDAEPVIAVGRRLLGLKPRSSIPGEFDLWAIGPGPGEADPARITRLASCSGLVLLRSENWWCLADCGGVGQRGHGGHAHNDTLSFVLYLGDAEVITDPGTGGYTRDPVLRNSLRRTRAHATVEIDGDEINPFTEGSLFTLGDCDSPEIDEMVDDNGRLFVSAHHRGYERLPDPVMHARTWELTDENLVIIDELTCRGAHRAVVTFPLGLGVEAEPTDSGWSLKCGAQVVALCQLDGPRVELARFPGPVSDAYGAIVDSTVLRGAVDVNGTTRWSFTFARGGIGDAESQP
jgi:Heparinase II/III-like protein/Heparinase II/III N-terminus